MLNRLRTLPIYVETALMGLFFVQALRFFIGALYSSIAATSLVASYPAGTEFPEAVNFAATSSSIALLGLVLGLPLIALILGRLQPLFVAATIVAAIGRFLIVAPNAPIEPIIAAEITLAASLLYVALLIHNRLDKFPHFFVLGFALDQVIRASFNTLDPNFASGFINVQLGLSILAIVASLSSLTPLASPEKPDTQPGNKGLLPLWSAIGLGGILFLEISLLGLPNAVTRRANADYTTFVPLLLVATILPLVPEVRLRLRRFISPFDSGSRGWVWLVIIALLLVIGTRVQRLPLGGLGIFPLGGLALVLAQFTVCSLFWWFVRPRAENERNLGALWLIISMVIFAMFVVFDIFTYEYAFVRNFAISGNVGLTNFLNTYLVPLLRGFRGLGLGVILIAAFFAALPMIQARRRIPWQGGTFAELVTSLLFGIGCIAVAISQSAPPRVQPVVDVDSLRVSTYNIHAGYSEFFEYDLEGIKQAIQQSGASVVLMQEVEAGRLTSYGVDQTLWLARELGMDRRFFATNEGLRGLAVLSRVPIVFDDGVLIPSLDEQTGLQRVQIQPGLPEEGAITLYNTSLGLLIAGDTLEEQERNQRLQLNRILEIIGLHIENDYGGQLGRALLGGTFHNQPSSPLLQTLTNTGFVDPFAGQNLELSATLRRTNLPPARFDYLWLWSQSLQSSGVGVIPNDASDHRLAFVEIIVRSR